MTETIPKAAILDSINPAASKVFEDAGFEVVKFDKGLSSAELSTISQNATILGVRSGPKVTSEILHPNLEVVSVFGVGTNHISLKSDEGKGANELGIAVFNSAHENTRSVAELVIGNTFALLRGIASHNKNMHDGRWTKEDGLELRGKTMGIIGYGAIGGQVSVLAESMGMDVVAYDPAPQIPPQGRTKMAASLEELLQSSDVVTLHAPANPATEKMINADTLSQMKPGSYLINAARAEQVDYVAVADALASGHLAGVAADVFDKEPSKKGDKFDHILRGLEGVVLTPHIGGSTAEAQRNIGETVASRSVAYVETGSTTGSVNIPNLALNGRDPGTSRLLNIHDNRSGVMANLAALVAEAGLNVVDTRQKAAGEIGYIAFDIEGEVPEDVLTVMRALHSTRRARVIA